MKFTDDDESVRRSQFVGEGSHPESNNFAKEAGLNKVSDEQYFHDKEQAMEAYRRWRDAKDEKDLFQLEHQNKERLEDIFEEEFHPDNPPESYRRLERFLTLRNLTRAVHSSAGGVYIRHDGDIAALVDAEEGEPPTSEIEHAKDLIDLMATFSVESEPHLSTLLGSPTLPLEVRTHAVHHLDEIRHSSNEASQDIVSRIKSWFNR